VSGTVSQDFETFKVLSYHNYYNSAETGFVVSQSNLFETISQGPVLQTKYLP
jgi:hypothetical protein